ncbi:MAG: hypothetical protein AAGA21_10675 [Pseudomonadota bacterium]
MNAQKGQTRKPIDFAEVNTAARANLLPILQRWLPGGRQQGNEYLALNPHRVDRHLGSFRINLRTGRWADFATGDKCGDVVSLAAFLFGLTQIEAARRLAEMLGLSHG